MSTSGFNYQQFSDARLRIAQILASLANEFQKLEAQKRAQSLGVTRDSLLDDAFRVLVLGEFSRGKSTLINALLGAQVLPAKVAPCTAVITRLRYGERKQAILRYRDGHDETIDLATMPDELKRRITIIDQQKNPIEFCDVYFPLSLLRNGVEIVDSPGLNESEVRTEITRAFFDRTDAIVLVLNCEQAFSASEQSFLESELRDRDLRDVFFLWNRYDAIRDSPEDLADITRLSKEKLEVRLGGRSRVFFVSARDALKAKLQNNPTLLEYSNLIGFERALEEFLANERGRVKLRGPIRIAQNALEEGLTKLIPHREKLMRKPVDDLRQIFEQQKPGLEAAERQQQRILRTIDRRKESIEREAVSLIRALVLDIEGSITRAAGKIDVGTWEALANQSATRQRVTQQISAQVSEQLRDWEKTVFRPTIEAAFANLEQDLNDEVGELLTSLDKLDLAFDESGAAHSISSTALSRLVAPGQSTTATDLGTVIQAATGGTGNVLAGFGVTIVTGVALTVLHVPILVIGGALAALGLGGTILGGQRRANDIRKAAVDQLSNAMRERRAEMESATVERIDLAMSGLRTQIEDRMAIRIDEVRGQVESVLRDKEKLESQATNQLEILNGCRQSMDALTQELQALQPKVSA